LYGAPSYQTTCGHTFTEPSPQGKQAPVVSIATGAALTEEPSATAPPIERRVATPETQPDERRLRNMTKPFTLNRKLF
jgi:hypothetical protein